MVRSVRCVAALAAALCVCLSAPLSVAADDHDHSTCTNGRLFVSDANAALIHVLDLDAEPVAVIRSLPAHAPAMSLYSTGTALDRVLAMFGGNNTVTGRVQVFRSGLTVDNHGDHFDIVKNAPAAYSFAFDGFKPSHFTASAGFISIFYDGVYGASSTDAINQPASAQFVAESVFTEDSLNVVPTPVTVTVEGKGAHHGVAYALGPDAFLVTEPSDARAAWASSTSTPNGMKVYNAAGSVIADLNDQSDVNKRCNSSHGSAHIGNQYLFGCINEGLLRVEYSPSTGVSSSKLTYPVPVADKVHRTSTLYAQRAGNMFVANLIDGSASDAAVVPSFLLNVPADSTTLSTDQALRTDTGTARFCSFAVDQGNPEVVGTGVVAALMPDGMMRVSAVNASTGAVISTQSITLVPTAITCSNYVLAPGMGKMHVLDKAANRLHTVSLEAVLEQDLDHAVTTTNLAFTPARGVVSIPNIVGVVCEAEHSHGKSSAVSHGASIGTIFALAAASALAVSARLL